MITRVWLENYLSHKHTDVVLDSLTSIVGRNNHGKSTIFRAIETILTVGPFTEQDIHWGEKTAVIGIQFDSGVWIERQRTKSSQLIVIFDGDKITEYTTTVGVKKVIEDLVGVYNVKLDENSPAESLQIVPSDTNPFWLLDEISPENLLRRINKLMVGSGIEDAKKRFTSDISKIDSSIKEKQIQITKLETELAIVQEVLSDKLYEDAQIIHSGIKRTELQIIACNNNIDKLTAVIRLETRYDEAELDKLLQSTFDEIEQLQELEQRYTMVEENIRTLTRCMNVLTTKTDAISNDKKRLKELQQKLAQLPKCPKCGKFSDEID